MSPNHPRRTVPAAPVANPRDRRNRTDIRGGTRHPARSARQWSWRAEPVPEPTESVSLYSLCARAVLPRPLCRGFVGLPLAGTPRVCWAVACRHVAGLWGCRSPARRRFVGLSLAGTPHPMERGDSPPLCSRRPVAARPTRPEFGGLRGQKSAIPDGRRERTGEAGVMRLSPDGKGWSSRGTCLVGAWARLPDAQDGFAGAGESLVDAEESVFRGQEGLSDSPHPGAVGR